MRMYIVLKLLLVESVVGIGVRMTVDLLGIKGAPNLQFWAVDLRLFVLLQVKVCLCCCSFMSPEAFIDLTDTNLSIKFTASDEFSPMIAPMRLQNIH